MSRQFDEYMEDKFEYQGERKTLIYPTSFAELTETFGGRNMNESRFSNYFIEKWDLSYPRSLAIWGFPLFHVKAPILQNAPNAKLIFLCMAAI